MLRLAEKAFYPAKIPFPVLHVDTGLRLPRGPRAPRPLGRPARPAARRRLRRGRHRRAAWSSTTARPAATGMQTGTLLQRHRGGRLHRRLRWRPPRRGEGPRQGARLLPPRRVRPVGPEEPAPRALEPLQRPDPRGRAHADLPAVQLDRARHLALHRPRGDRDPRRSTSPTSARSSSATACCWPSPTFNPAARATRPSWSSVVRFRTVGDATLTGAVESDGRHDRRDHRRDRRRPGHRARRHPWRRQVLRGRHGRPQEGRLLLMPHRHLLSASPPPAPSTTASRTLIGRLLLDSKSIFEDQLEAVEATSAVPRLRLHRPRAADRRPARRARAGHHHRRGLPLLRDAQAASSSSPTPRATCSTPATWSPAPPPPTSAWCSSTPARASPSSPAGTRCSLSLLRVPHLVLAVNKMDLVDYVRGGLRARSTRSSPPFATKLNIPDLRSSRSRRCSGDNVVHPLREHAVVRRPVAAAPPRARARRLRPQPGRRPLPGAVRRPARSPTSSTTTAATPARSPAACSSRATRSSCCPSGMTSTIAGIDLFDKEVDEAFPPMSVTVRLEDDVDVSRGDMIARATTRPKPSQDIDAMVCWMTNEPLRPRQKLAIKHTTRAGRALVKDIQYRLDVNTPAPRPGHQGARPQRDRPRPAAHHRAAAVRPLLARTAPPARSS